MVMEPVDPELVVPLLKIKLPEAPPEFALADRMMMLPEDDEVD